MIGLDSYSRQVFNYLDPSLIFISLWIDCLFEIRKNCSMFPLAFIAGSLQGHWWGFISWNYVVWPIFFLMNVFIALKRTHFFIFTWICLQCSWCCAVWRSYNVSLYINHNAAYILFLVLWDHREYSEKSEINDWFRLMFLIIWTPCWFLSVMDRLPIWNSQNCSMFPLAFIAGSTWSWHGNWWGFISRNYVVWPIFLMTVFIALKALLLIFICVSFDLSSTVVTLLGKKEGAGRCAGCLLVYPYFVVLLPYCS